MKFACLVYHEHKDTISEAELSAIVAECRDAAAWNEGIKKAGHHVFTSGLQGPGTARTVEIVQRGRRHSHHELKPKVEMPVERFEELLKQVVLEPMG